MTEADKYVVLRLSQGHGVDTDARSLKNAAIAPNDKVRASNASEVTNVQQSNSGDQKVFLEGTTSKMDRIRSLPGDHDGSENMGKPTLSKYLPFLHGCARGRSSPT